MALAAAGVWLAADAVRAAFTGAALWRHAGVALQFGLVDLVCYLFMANSACWTRAGADFLYKFPYVTKRHGALRWRDARRMFSGPMPTRSNPRRTPARTHGRPLPIHPPVRLSPQTGRPWWRCGISVRSGLMPASGPETGVCTGTGITLPGPLERRMWLMQATCFASATPPPPGTLQCGRGNVEQRFLKRQQLVGGCGRDMMGRRPVSAAMATASEARSRQRGAQRLPPSWRSRTAPRAGQTRRRKTLTAESQPRPLRG